MELVVDLGEVLLHLIELHALDVDPRILLAVSDGGLEAHVQVGVRDGGGGGAQGLEGQVNGLHAVGAHLEADQIRRGLDRVLAVGELTEAARIAQVDDDGAGAFLRLSADLLGEVAVQQRGDLLAVVGQERQGEHQQARAEVELAAAHALGDALNDLLEHFLLGAQLAIAEDLHGHMAVGLLSDVRCELLHGDVARVAFRLRMAHHHDIAAQILVGVLVGQRAHAAQRENDGQGKSKELLHLDYLLLMFDAAPERRILVYIY